MDKSVFASKYLNNNRSILNNASIRSIIQELYQYISKLNIYTTKTYKVDRLNKAINDKVIDYDLDLLISSSITCNSSTIITG